LTELLPGTWEDHLAEVITDAGWHLDAEAKVSPSVVRKCLCVAEHRPTPLAYESHHIWPLGMGGPDVAANRVWLCPTAHTNAHEILRELMRSGRLSWTQVVNLFPVPVSRYAYSVAIAGYEAWVTGSIHPPVW
jgi:hypothetical protein